MTTSSPSQGETERTWLVWEDARGRIHARDYGNAELGGRFWVVEASAWRAEREAREKEREEALIAEGCIANDRDAYRERAEQAEEALREGEQVVMDALAMLRRPHAEELKRSEPYKRFKAALAGLPEREVNQQPQLPPRDRKMFGAGLPEGEKR